MMDDLISRQEAIDLIEDIETKRLRGEIGLMYAPAIKGIKALPSAQPEIEERMSETEQNVPNDDFISRKRAIDALMEDFKRIPTNAIRAKTVIEHLPSAQPEQQWIPCSERLPEEIRKSYWICTDAGYQCECRWTNINHLFTDLTMKWHWHIMDVPQYDSVVAWMPLPEPWRGE